MNEYAIGILEEKKERLIKKGRDVLGNTINKLQKAIDTLSTKGRVIEIENTEAYCENLQRENQYLRDKLSPEGKVICSDCARWELKIDRLKSFIEMEFGACKN
jgi:FtsZ-binding cell division protein ZapB